MLLGVWDVQCPLNFKEGFASGLFKGGIVHVGRHEQECIHLSLSHSLLLSHPLPLPGHTTQYTQFHAEMNNKLNTLHRMLDQ